MLTPSCFYQKSPNSSQLTSPRSSSLTSPVESPYPTPLISRATTPTEKKVLHRLNISRQALIHKINKKAFQLIEKELSEYGYNLNQAAEKCFFSVQYSSRCSVTRFFSPFYIDAPTSEINKYKLKEFYRKDEVLSLFRIYSFEIPVMRGYLTKLEKSIRKKYSQNFIPKEIVHHLNLPNLRTYVHSFDYAKVNKRFSLEHLQQKNLKSFVYKKGKEVTRELLAQKIAYLLKLDNFLVIKTKYKEGAICQWVDNKKQTTAHLELMYESINELALLDLLLCSYDSHENQYAFSEACYCFDFARFLPPSYAYISFGSLYVSFRSFLIDHKYCKSRIPQKIINKFKNFDIEKFKSNCKKYHLIYSKEKEKEVLNYLNLSKKQPPCYFTKIHSKAFQGLLKRLQILKDYLNEEQNPSMYQLFEKLYPKLKRFRNVISKIKQTKDGLMPGEALAFYVLPTGVLPLSLEQIVKICSESPLITIEEKKALSLDLENIKKDACSYDELKLCMDMIF